MLPGERSRLFDDLVEQTMALPDEEVSVAEAEVQVRQLLAKEVRRKTVRPSEETDLLKYWESFQTAMEERPRRIHPENLYHMLLHDWRQILENQPEAEATEEETVFASL